MEKPLHRRSVAQRFRIVVALSLAFQLVVLIALAVVIGVNARQQERYARAQRVITTSYRLMSLLSEIEGSVRGYAMSKDIAFTEPYHRAAKTYPAELAALRAIAGAGNVAPLDAGARRIFAFHTRNLERVRAGRMDLVMASVRSGTGRRLMEAFRRDIMKFLADQQRDIDEHSRALVRSQRVSMAALTLGFGVNVVVALAGLFFFSQSISNRVSLLIENATRFEQGRPLHRMAKGDDELSELDRRFHEMAAALTAGRRQLERAHQELESFSYSVSHDLRAPVRALNGYAQILEEDYSASLDGEGRRFLGVIRSEARRLGALIDDLLAFSRLGKAPMRHGVVDVEELAREVVREVCGEAGADIRPMPQASGDRGMLRHVLVNLVSNAAKFSAPKGAPLIEIGGEARDGGKENTYWVRDHGVGFDMRYAHKLFGVFQRLHDETDFEGTGVGLAIVKRVVERHGGRVWAESTAGEGATFFFTLPAASGGET